MNKINVTVGQTQALRLSEARLKSALDGDHAALQRMGWFDRLKDSVFNHGAKRAALTELAQELAKDFDASQGTAAFDRFTKLARMAAPLDRSQFTVAIKGTAEEPNVVYRVKQFTVKTEALNPAELEVLRARWGVIPGSDATGNDRAADWLGPHELVDLEQARAQLQDSAFQTGGKHKRFDKDTGILRAEDHHGAQDFEREKLIADLAETNPALSRYVSTQRVIDQANRAALLPQVQSNKAHAQVTMYNPAHVHSNELDQELSQLSSAEARSVLMQTVDMARVFYQAGISHRDLHMHNLMVYKPLDPSVGQVTLKAIDFGKSRVGMETQDDKLNDLNYLFQKKASSGKGETAWRNAREILGVGAERQAKHYPLHKLLVHCARAGGAGRVVADDAFDDTIKSIGICLNNALTQAQGLPEDLRPAAIDEAFNEAMSTLSQVADTIGRVEVQPHFIRG